MAAPNAATLASGTRPVRIALGLHFVRTTHAGLSAGAGPTLQPAQQALNNVVVLSDLQRWLAALSQDTTLSMDPGPQNPDGSYSVLPFMEFLNAQLAPLSNPPGDYTGALFMGWHIIKDGQWVEIGGHLFKLMAHGMPVTQEARADGVDFLVETLISVEVLE